MSEPNAAEMTSSLGLRLSWWLAVQSLVGLLIVSTIVYVVSSSSQDKRQVESLQQKQAIVNHLLGEVDAANDLAVLRHKLDDFFLGHADLRVRLQGPANEVFYENSFPTASSRPTRSIAYEAPVRINNVPVRVLLELDTTDDRIALTQLAWTLGVSALLGSALISAGGFVLVRAGLSPVRGLVRQTELLGASTMGQRLDGSQQPRELQPLVHRFNGLLDRLQGAYDQLEGFNANVAILDINMDRLRYLSDVMPPNVDVLFSDRHIIREQLRLADLVIGAVLIPGAKAPRLIEREQLKEMKQGSVIIDVAIDLNSLALSPVSLARVRSARGLFLSCACSSAAVVVCGAALAGACAGCAAGLASVWLAETT